MRRLWSAVPALVVSLALVGSLLLPGGAGAEAEFAQPGSIEGTVTRTGGAKVKGVEVCAFDVAEDEEFTECAETSSNGYYEIEGLDEGPYRVEFKSGESGLGLATQYWKGAATAAKATILHVEEARAIGAINAEMKVGASAAAGGTEFGDPCEFTFIEAGAAGFEFRRPGSPLPAAAPVAGVLTKWIVNTSSTLPTGIAPVDVRVIDIVGKETAEIVAKSALETLGPGRNTFETRLPIAAGDRLALGSNESPTPACGKPDFSGELAGAYFESPVVQPGSKQTFFQLEFGVPVVGVIEPDADGDGYGDETQDGCPQSAAFHAACPTVSFTPGYTVGPRSIRLHLRSSAKTPVAVTAAMPGPGFLHARATAARGKATTIKVPIPPSFAARLRQIDSSKSLTLRFRAHATAVEGVPSTDHLTVRVPGRG